MAILLNIFQNHEHSQICFLTRLIFVFISFSILIFSFVLEPSTTNYGTHESLGLPKCITSKIFKIKKCPSCGLTTSFVLISRGEIKKAITIHPWSPILYVLNFSTLILSSISLIFKNITYWLFLIVVLFIVGSAYTTYWIIEMIKLVST